MCEIEGYAEYCGDSKVTQFPERIVRLRKQRVCVVCNLPIAPEHFAVAKAFVYEGQGKTEHLHLQCRALCLEVQGAYFHDEVMDSLAVSCGDRQRERFLALVRWAHGESWAMDDEEGEDK